ncbi:hypothetical protein DJ031_04130 [bacterium endosymbiont of Escarpia laminata]|nr:MAG: hypothetical protein DJ031_04130 [bacterium endosymbiont of Escarpia laminata]
MDNFIFLGDRIVIFALAVGVAGANPRRFRAWITLTGQTRCLAVMAEHIELRLMGADQFQSPDPISFLQLA